MWLIFKVTHDGLVHFLKLRTNKQTAKPTRKELTNRICQRVVELSGGDLRRITGEKDARN